MKENKKQIIQTLILGLLTVLTGAATIWTVNRIYVKLSTDITAALSFKIGFLLMGSMIIFFLMVVTCIKKGLRSHNQLLFYLLLILSNTHMLGAVYAMAGAGGIKSLYAGQLISLISTPTVLIVFWFYQRNIFLGENYKKKAIDYIVLAAGILDHAQIYFGSYLGKIYSFDQNKCYIPGSWTKFTYIYPVAVLILCIIDNFRRKATREKHISCFLFAFAPMAMALVAVITNDYVYSHTAYVISLLIIFVGIQANMELDRVKQEEIFSIQQELLQKDALTQLFSRFAYSKDLDAYESAEKLPYELVIFAMDVNGLKGANDTFGHEAGDELIKGAADCISESFSDFGKCYRTGGDEFVSILMIPKEQIPELVECLRNQTKKWCGNFVNELSISVGTAAVSEHPDFDIKNLIALADQEMYTDKALYYQRTGKNRRRAH